MEMSVAYLRQALEFFTSRGFILVSEERTCGQFEGRSVTATSHTITRSKGESLTIEHVVHPVKPEMYFLELAYLGLSSFSFPIDSWKIHAKYVEFRYYADPNGRGLSLKIEPQ
jgi:hypothetical protein